RNVSEDAKRSTTPTINEIVVERVRPIRRWAQRCSLARAHGDGRRTHPPSRTSRATILRQHAAVLVEPYNPTHHAWRGRRPERPYWQMDRGNHGGDLARRHDVEHVPAPLREAPNVAPQVMLT